MRKILFKSSVFVLLALVFWACQKDDSMDPTIEGLAIDNYDVIQLTNDNPDVPVFISFSDDRSIDSVVIKIMTEGTTNVVARNVIRNITHNTAERIMVKTPFPFPDLGGPTGFYTVEYTIYDRAGRTNTKSYNLNILNNKTRNLCSFPTMPLPAGKNVWVRVTSTQPLPANQDVYVTGSFEAANGGTGDWTGGVSTFKLTRLSPNCFYIPLNLTSANEFKFTLGDWSREALGNMGQTPSNSTWNGAGTQDFIIYNWKGNPIVNQTIPLVLPAAGIVTGSMSVIADVASTDDNLKYFLVQKGGNLNDESYPMHRVVGTTKVMGAVPKNSNIEYIVVRKSGTVVKEGVNDWGFVRSVKWDGRTNPVNVSIPKFKDDTGIFAPPANLYIVGGATPGGWSNPVPVPSQRFTQVSPGKFELASIALTSGQEYLLLPVNGDWSAKYGGNFKLSGDIIVQGPNIPAPDVTGNYKITVDFTTGRYTLVKL